MHCTSFHTSFIMHSWKISIHELIFIGMYESLIFHALFMDKNLIVICTLLNQVCAAKGRTCLVSWNCFGLCVGMCACVSAPEAINNQWCNIDRVRLVKQVLWLFPAFNYFIRHLPSIECMGVVILTQHVVNACQRKLRWHGINYKRTTRKTGCFIY